MEEPLEGWYTDPLARHEARWLSAGKPTALVRDNGVEGSDPVSGDEAFAVAPVKIVPEPRGGASTLLRADDAESEPPFNREKAVDAADEAFGRIRE